MTSCTVRGSVSVTAEGRFAPQGVIASSGPLKTAVVVQKLLATLGNLTYGTAVGKCDVVVAQDRTLTATTAATYDLYTGTDLKDLVGGTAALRKVKLVAVGIVTGGDSAGVLVGGAASDAWASFFADASDKHKIFPSGLPYLGASPAGVAVGTTTKNFKLENLGAVAVTLRIILAGTSA